MTFSTVFAFIILHGYSSTYVQILDLVESDDFRDVRKFKNSPLVAAHPSCALIKRLLAESLRTSGVVPHSSPSKILSVQRRPRCTPLRGGDSDTRRPCWTLSLRFPRAFPLFFGLPIYGLFSAIYFGYVVTGRYVMSMWLLWYAT